MASDNAIELKNAFKSFGNTQILKGVDFTLRNGEFLALLGDNGAGKSTLIKCLCGYEKFDSFDEFKILQIPIAKDKFNLLKARNMGIEVVFQEGFLGGEQEIYRNIFATRHITKFGLIDAKKEIDVTNKILKEFLGFSGAGLDATSKAKNLSGGVYEKVIKQIEDLGADVVAFENCSGTKGYQNQVQTKGDPVANIAERYLKIPCSVMYQNDARSDIIKEFIHEYQAHGVIDVVLSGCHTYAIETNKIKEAAVKLEQTICR